MILFFARSAFIATWSSAALTYFGYFIAGLAFAGIAAAFIVTATVVGSHLPRPHPKGDGAKYRRNQKRDAKRREA